MRRLVLVLSLLAIAAWPCGAGQRAWSSVGVESSSDPSGAGRISPDAAREGDPPGAAAPATGPPVTTRQGLNGLRDVPVPATGSAGIDWQPLLVQSMHALGWQHMFRIVTEERTRARMGRTAPLRNWIDCVTSLDNWDDGGKFFTNYVAHPMMGSASGWLLINNDARGRRVRPGDDGYWPSRMRALAFSTAYSVQYEIGPLSEATMGLSPDKQGWVDFVLTPAIGFGWLLGEDALDQVVRRIERRGSPGWTRVARTLMTPTRTLSNLAGLRKPWHRTDRGLHDEFLKEQARRRAGP
jgi:hypothetical protein